MTKNLAISSTALAPWARLLYDTAHFAGFQATQEVILAPRGLIDWRFTGATARVYRMVTVARWIADLRFQICKSGGLVF